MKTTTQTGFVRILFALVTALAAMAVFAEGALAGYRGW